MADHTKEPWAEDGIGNVGAVSSDQWNAGYFTAECGGPDKLANARRIVACVNACAGLPIESLELGIFADGNLAEAVKAKVEADTLRARVAELEAKLRVAEEALANVQKLDYFQEHNWLARNVDAALSKIKESA